MRATLVLVGGFLGAGKTTLLLEAARRLRAEGRGAAVITNDQGGELVDTRLARAAGLAAEEVAGGCFCCRFSDFVASAGKLLASAQPDVILAEPVGSCTDLAATLVRPLTKFYGERFRVAPLTVLADPARAAELLAPDADPNLAYLFRQQLAEADLVCFSKADRYEVLPRLDGVRPRRLSVHTGEGVSEWLAEVLDETRTAGGRTLEIDYRRYAEAEAALGWLNWQADLALRHALTPAAVAGPLLEHLDRTLTDAGAAIAHLKVLVEASTGYLKASVCCNGEEPWIDGALDAPPARRHALVLNLRAVAAPERLEAAVEEAARVLPGRLRVCHQECFRPAAPVPEHRLTEAT